MVTYNEVPLCPSISLARCLRNFQQNDVLCDLILEAEDHTKIRVHKVVYAAMCGYIKKRVVQNESCDSFRLTDSSADAIASMADFIYGNVYAIHSENVRQIYPLAQLFECQMLCRVAEYIDPTISKTKLGNKKIIPVPQNSSTGNSDEENDDKETERSLKRKRSPTQTPVKKAKQETDDDRNGSKFTRKKISSEELSVDKDNNNVQKNKISTDKDNKNMSEKTKEIEKNKSKGLATPSPKKKPKVDETVFECGKCKLIFVDLSKCNEHMASVHGVAMVAVNENFICSKAGCGYKCNSADTLKKHVILEHPQILVKNHICGICDANFDTRQALENHNADAHSKGKSTRENARVNGKEQDSQPDVNHKDKVTSKPGPKSSKLKRESDANTNRKEIVPTNPNVKVTNISERELKIEDGSLLDGWSKLLIARRDFSKYDFYIQSPEGKKFRSLKDLITYLDANEIAMETDHLSFSTASLMEEAGIPHLKSQPTGGFQKRGRPRRSMATSENENADNTGSDGEMNGTMSDMMSSLFGKESDDKEIEAGSDTDKES